MTSPLATNPPPTIDRQALRLSVALCTYNGAAFLLEQLDSIARQTYLPAEVLVYDDRSRDQTIEITRQWAATTPFPVRVKIHAENLGSTRNFASAITDCIGDLIVLCDQDDVWLPHKLDRIARLFTDNPSAEAVFTDGWVVDQHLVKRSLLSGSVGFRGTVIQRDIAGGRIVARLAARCLATGATMAFRSRLREQVLPIPDNLPHGLIHDGWIALVAALRDGLRFLDEPLILYRQHANQQIGVSQDSLGWTTGQARRKIREALPIATDQLIRAVTARFPEYAGRMSPFCDQLAHLRVRGALPDSRAGRIMPVLGELLRGRYHRYAKGFRTGLADLFY